MDHSRYGSVGPPLSQAEHDDALSELVQIAVSGASARLRDMIGSAVNLTAPVVDIFNTSAAVDWRHWSTDERIITVSQAFTGSLSGQMCLVLSDRDSQKVARLVIGEADPDLGDHELIGDTLGEIGNVLLLGFLASIGSLLQMTFSVDLPKVEATTAKGLFLASQGVFLVIDMNFDHPGSGARGHFSLILRLSTADALRDVVSGLVERVT